MLSNEKKNGLLWLGACLFFSYLFPYHVSPFRAFYNDWLAIFGLFILTAYLFRGKVKELAIPWILSLPLLLTAVIVLQLSLGMFKEPWDAFLPICYLLCTIVALSLGASVVSEKGGHQALWLVIGGALLGAALISVMIASLQLTGAEMAFVPFAMLMKHATINNIRPFANIGQPNQLALLLCCALAAVWWFYQSFKLNASLAILASICLLWGLALTQSRIGWIISPLFAGVLYYWQRRQHYRVVRATCLIGLLLVYVAFVVFLLPALSHWLNIYTMTAAEHVAGSSPRLVFYREAWKMSLAHPLLGVGWFQFGPHQVALALQYPDAEYSQYVHNILLNFLAETGWPITIGIVAIFAFWSYKTFFFATRTKETAASMLVIAAVLVHSMVEYPLWYAYILVPTALLMGGVHEENNGSVKITFLQPYRYATVLVAVACLLGVAEDYRKVAAGFWELGMKSMGVEVKNYEIKRPAITIFPYVYDFFDFMNTPPTEGISKRKIESMDRAVTRFIGPQILVRMSQVYALNNQPTRAIEDVLIVRKLYGAGNYRAAYSDWSRAPEKFNDIKEKLPMPENSR